MSGLNLLSTNKNSAAFRPGYAPTGLADTAAAMFPNQRQNYNVDAEIRLVGEPLHERNSIISKRLGKPISEITGTNLKYLNPTVEGRAQQLAEDNDLIDTYIEKGRKENPGLWEGVQTTAEIREEGKRKAGEAAQNYEEVAARNPSALSRVTGSLAGGVAGAFTDPVNIMTLPIGAGETKIVGAGALATARGITIAAMKEGALQASIEAASIPQIAQWQQTVGHQYGFSEAATDVAFGFLGGAGIRAGAEGIVPSLRAVRRGAEKTSSYVLDKVAASPNIAQTVKDSLKYMSRAAYIDDEIPVPPRSQKDLQQHRAAVDKVAKDVESYQRPAPELPGVSKIVTPRNELELEVKARVVELDDLITSDMASFDQSLQPRDRSNRMASDVRINEIAARLDPAQLGDSRVSNTGSPIVGPDMMTESGNGRVMALKRVYEAHPDNAKRYRDFLEGQGHSTKGFKRPVLVRQRISELTPAQRKQFVVYSNEDVADRLSTTERAMADAKLMSSNVMQSYKGGDIENAINSNFVRDFIDKAVSPSERNAYLTPGGRLSQDGVKRIRAAMLARAYSDADLVQKLLEDTDTNIKTIGSVLMDLSGDWSKLRGDIADGHVPPMFDITRDIMDAVKTVVLARNEGRPITDFVNQRGLFAETDLTAETTAILRGMYNDKMTRALGYDKTKEFLSFYMKEAAKQQSGPDLLGGKPVDPMDILSIGLERVHGKEATGQMNFDRGGSPEISAVREAGLQDLVKNVKHPTKGISFFKALEDMAARPETLKAKGAKGKARKELQSNIIRELDAEQKKAVGGDFGTDRVAEIVLGPLGAGKSSVLVKRLQKDLKAVIIDSDMIKEKMPEFDDGIGANAVHEESKLITQEWLDDKVLDGANIIHPIVGANPEKVGALVDTLSRNGYAVNIRLVHIPADESLKRVIKRFGDEGRLVPPSYVLGIDDGPVKTFDILKQREDINAYSYFDNNVEFGKEPRIVESNDPRFIASQKAGSGLRGDASPLGQETAGALDAEKVNELFDDNAYRLREYRETPITPPSEIKPSDRLAANQARFAALVKENPDMIITAEDGSSISLADYASRMKEDEKVLEAITTCRLS